MEYRASPTSPTQTLTWDEFHAMVRRGEVAPSSLVRASVVTGDAWWSADNLAVFHRESPLKYPHGPYLEAELERARQKKARLARIDDAMRPYFEACEQPWLVEDCYGISPLEVVATRPNVIGASRLTISASFAPEYVVTCAFTSGELQVEAVTGSMPAHTALWVHFRASLDAEIEEEPLPANPPTLEIRRATMSVALNGAPRPFRSWETLVGLTRAAPSCDNQALDGVRFSHDLRGGDVRLRAAWVNPTRQSDGSQLDLVAAYRAVLAKTGIVIHRRVL